MSDIDQFVSNTDKKRILEGLAKSVAETLYSLEAQAAIHNRIKSPQNLVERLVKDIATHTQMLAEFQAEIEALGE